MRLCCQCIVTPCGNVTSVSLQTCASGGKPWRRYTLHGPVLRSLHYILLAGIRTNVSVCNTIHILCDKVTAHSRHGHTWTCTLLACCVYCLDGDVTDWTILGLRPHSHGSILVNTLHCICKPKPEVEPTRRKSGRICSSSVFWT